MFLEKFKNIWAPIILHAGANLLSVLLTMLLGESTALSDMKPGIAYISHKAENGGEIYGFECPKANFVLLSDNMHDVSHGGIRKGSVRTAKNKKSAKNHIKSYAELTVGDIVVHDTHGIGIYDGIKTLTAAGVTRDYITIKYVVNIEKKLNSLKTFEIKSPVLNTVFCVKYHRIKLTL